MIRWFKRKNLVKRGLSCGKTRKEVTPNQLADILECSPWLKWGIILLCFFGCVQLSRWGAAETWSLHATVLRLLMIFTAGLLALRITLPQVWHSNQMITLTLGCMICNIFLNKLLIVTMNDWALLQEFSSAILVPASLGAMLITILISPGAGIFVTFFLALIGMVVVRDVVDLLLSTLLTGFAAVYFTRHIRRRVDLWIAGAFVGLVGMICVVLLTMVDQGLPQGGFVLHFLRNGLAAALIGLATAVGVMSVLPLLEWLFERITPISWLEQGDLNHPLLKRMAIEAPGTYQHSLMVANLAENAAEAIGANAAQCRVMAYFHDIGKLSKPSYFIENANPDENPHDGLNPSMSALVIISHVKDGVDLAIKHHLSRPIIEAIQQHHGTSLVYYFYRRALQQMEDARQAGKMLNYKEEDIPEVDERSFRYPGPIPQSRELAILSLADSIESAARAIEKPTASKIENLVHDMIHKRISEGQLNDSHLTFNELNKISERFIFILKNMYHVRVSYPKDPAPNAPHAKDARTSKSSKEISAESSPA